LQNTPSTAPSGAESMVRALSSSVITRKWAWLSGSQSWWGHSRWGRCGPPFAARAPQSPPSIGFAIGQENEPSTQSWGSHRSAVPGPRHFQRPYGWQESFWHTEHHPSRPLLQAGRGRPARAVSASCGWVIGSLLGPVPWWVFRAWEGLAAGLPAFVFSPTAVSAASHPPPASNRRAVDVTGSAERAHW